ncbi:MAG: hypothetical protein AB8G05_02915 [Oligoflexales bacterium]
MKTSAYGNFISSLQSLNIILRNKSLREITGQLSFLADQKKIESDFSIEFKTKYLESLSVLEFFIPRYLDDQPIINHSSTLASYLIESVIWEVINEETFRTVQQIVKGKITPYIWSELKKDVLKQIWYHIKNQGINGIKNPEIISTDLMVGDYKIIRINELYKGHKQRMQNIIEESSSHYASKNLYSLYQIELMMLTD